MFKKIKEAIKISLEINDCVANKPYEIACLNFNTLKSKYAEKVIIGKFSEDDYKSLFIDHDVDYYIGVFEKKA